MTGRIWLCKICFRMFIGAVPPGEMCPYCNHSSEDQQIAGPGHYRVIENGEARWANDDDDDSDGSLYL